jgi:type IV pilus assembly protein PilX
MHKNFIQPIKTKQQKGATLFVTVILVLVLSIVALAVYQQASFDERNARAQADRLLATQAAEIALRDAEYDLQCQQFSTNAAGASIVVACNANGTVLNNAANVGQNSCRSTCIPNSRLRVDRLLLGFDAVGTNGLWAGKTDTQTIGSMLGYSNPKPWQNRANWDTLNTNINTVQLGRYTGTQPIPIVAQQPRYLIEGFTDSERNVLFRITAKGWGRNPTTEVTLQQTYRP